MNSSILQNPSDPDATYRKKAGKEHRGYAANVEESVGKNGSVVTDYQFDSNNKSDSEFFQEHIEKIGPQEEKTIISDRERVTATFNRLSPPVRFSGPKFIEIFPFLSGP